jgi:hypothetical protein
MEAVKAVAIHQAFGCSYHPRYAIYTNRFRTAQHLQAQMDTTTSNFQWSASSTTVLAPQMISNLPLNQIRIPLHNKCNTMPKRGTIFSGAPAAIGTF